MENMETVRRGPGRPPLNRVSTEAVREPVPGYRDPAERAREIIESLNGGLEPLANKFDLPPGIVPEGWEYMWVRASTYGNSEGALGGENMKSRARAGWEPVPASRHPDLMPHGSKSAYIEREGLILHERPKQIGDQMRIRDIEIARAMQRDKERSLSVAGPGEGPRGEDAHPALRQKVTTTVESSAVPRD